MRKHMYVFKDCLDNNGNCSVNETCVTDPKFAPTNRCICKQGYQKNRLWETCTGRCFKNNCHCVHPMDDSLSIINLHVLPVSAGVQRSAVAFVFEACCIGLSLKR